MKHFQLTFTAKKTDHLSDGVSCNIISVGTKKDEDHMLTASFTVSEDLADAINNISMAHVTACTDAFSLTSNGYEMDVRPTSTIYVSNKMLGDLVFDDRFKAKDIKLFQDVDVVINSEIVTFVFESMVCDATYYCEMPIAELKNHPI